MPSITVHVLPPSHPCLAVEAALRLKGLEYERVVMESGRHGEPMEAIYGPGNTTVPGMVVDGEPVHGSRAIMERLKYELPIWKKETYADGRSEWVGPDNHPAETSREALPVWDAELLEIWISEGNDYRGRHQQDRLQHRSHSPSTVECVAGMGLRGDRYFGYRPDYKGQVTFFEAATVEAVRRELSLPDLSSSVFRRNLIVRGIDLGAWTGRKFTFQGIDFQGTEECKPCYWMDEAAGPGAEKFMTADFRGGLRARILTDGVLRVD